jgi:serine O-acetyltransferase
MLHDRDQKLIRAIHLYQSGRDRRGLRAWLCRLRGKLGHLLWSLLTASDISRDARIAASARFPHPTGVVIHRDAVVGENCLIMQQVTLGQLATGGAPKLEAGVYAGAGARILGPVRIGAGARIGANAVVLQDVPAGATAVGVPAVIRRRREA